MDFSVLMPLYSKENPEFLARSLESILVIQSIIPSEVVIVEDGPLTFDLYEVLENYSSLFPEIVKRFRLEKNMGMGYALNFGLNVCTHDWVFRMDSDDISRSERFKKQLEIIRQGSYDVVGSSIAEFNNCIGDTDRYRILPEHHHDIVSKMSYRCPINHMTVAYKREIAILAGGYWIERDLEDYNLWYEMAKINARFYNVQQVLVDARIGNNMIARRRGLKYFRSELKLLKKFRDDGFVGNSKFLYLSMLKLFARLLPGYVLNYFYLFVLRKKVNNQDGVFSF